MSRSITKLAFFTSISVLVLAAIACGGSSDKTSDVPTTTPSSVAATHTPAGNDSAASNGSSALSGIFETVFNSGVLDGSQPHTFDSGDETLKQYLLSDSDLPSGFTPEGTFTASVPASDSFSGGDAAVSIASKGGPNGTDFNGMMLGSLVVRTNDASQLEQAFSEAGAFSGDDLQNLLGSNSAPFITNVQTLDTSGLSDHAIGISVTMDFSQLISAFAGAFGASPDASDPSLTSMVMTMHIYMTVHGDLAAGVMSVAFGSASDDVNELALARIVDQKLLAAN